MFSRRRSVFLAGLAFVLLTLGFAGCSGSESEGVQDAGSGQPQANLRFYAWQENLLGPARDLQTEFSSADPEKVQEAQRRKWIDAGRLPAEGSNRYLISAGAEPTKRDALRLAAEQVRPGQTVVLTQRPRDFTNGLVDRGSEPGYFVLRDKPFLAREDIIDPMLGTDPDTGRPVVTFDFTDSGREKFERVTREIAKRKRTEQFKEGGFRGLNYDSYAIVVDDQILEIVPIDHMENPDGIDGGAGGTLDPGLDLEETEQLLERIRGE